MRLIGIDECRSAGGEGIFNCLKKRWKIIAHRAAGIIISIRPQKCSSPVKTRISNADFIGRQAYIPCRHNIICLILIPYNPAVLVPDLISTKKNEKYKLEGRQSIRDKTHHMKNVSDENFFHFLFPPKLSFIYKKL